MLHVFQRNNSIEHLSVAGYVNELFKCLDKYITNNQKPPLDDKKPPTLASTGPAYTSLNAVAEEMVKRRRGELAKPHFIEKPADTVVKPRATREKQHTIRTRSQQKTAQISEEPITASRKSRTHRSDQDIKDEPAPPKVEQSADPMSQPSTSRVLVSSKGKAPLRGKRVKKKSSQ